MATWAKGFDFKNSSNTTRIGGIGTYGTDAAVEKIYIGLGSEPWNNAGLQITNSSINFKGNKVYHAGDKPTAAEIGAAASSHTHSYLPLTGGTLTGALTLKLSGGTLAGAGITTGNTQLIGTSAETIYFGNPKTKVILESISNPSVSVNGTSYTMYHAGNKPTASEIGAAASSHTHSYLALSGGTLTGRLQVNTTGRISIFGNPGTATPASTIANQTSYIEIAAPSNTNHNSKTGIVFHHTNTSTNVLEYVNTDVNTGYFNFRSDDSSWNVRINGNAVYHTGNKPTAAEIGAAASSHNHTSLTGITSLGFNSHSSDAATIRTTVSDSITYLDMYMTDDVNQDKFRWRFKPYSTDSALAIERSLMELYCKTTSTTNTAHMDVFGSLKATDTITAPTFSGALSGNASTATKLQTARKLTIGSTGKTFDGSADVSWTLAEIGAAASSHTHSYLPLSGGTLTGALTLKFGGSTLTGAGITTGNTQLIGTAADTIYFGNPKTKVILESISNPSVSVNGTSYTMYHTGNKPTVSEIGAAASSHNHGLLHDNFTVTLANTTTDSGWSMINSSYSGFLLKSIRTQASAPNWITNNYGAGIAFGGSDTKGVISTAYNTPSIKFAGGNSTKPVWWIGLTGTSGVTYNLASLAANTANTLATARTINGTSFNGSANITTANWGTARNITIGNKTKSVNGSGNVYWTLDEIGVPEIYKYSVKFSGQTTSAAITLPEGTTTSNFAILAVVGEYYQYPTADFMFGPPPGPGYGSNVCTLYYMTGTLSETCKLVLIKV